MQIMNIAEKRFNKLCPLDLSDDIFNTEAKMYVFDEKEDSGNKRCILKRLYNDMGTVFSLR